MNNQPPANNFPIIEGDLDVPYQVIGPVEARVGAKTAFSSQKEYSDVNPKLAAEAAQLGANAVIQVTYERGMSMTSYKALTAKGVAVIADFSQTGAPPAPIAPASAPPVAPTPPASASPPPQPPSFSQPPPQPAQPQPTQQSGVGVPVPPTVPQAQAPAAQELKVGADKAVTALICGIAGLLCCGPISIFALVMGSNARKVAQETGRPLDGTMQAAWILGIVGLCFWLLTLVIYIIFVATGSGS